MKLVELYEDDPYSILEKSVLSSIKRFFKAGIMKIQTLNVVVVDTTIKAVESALKGMKGVVVTEVDGKINVAVSVEKESQFKTILNTIRKTDGNIVSVTK